MISIRAARPGDGVVLVETTRSLAESHGHGNDFAATAEHYERALFCDHPIVGALIAELNGEVAGSVVWHRSFSTNVGQEILYLEDISVLPAFRRRGVARALMQATAKLALALGYPQMFWMVMDWNVGAQKLYAACGALIEPDFQVCRIEGPALRELAR